MHGDRPIRVQRIHQAFCQNRPCARGAACQRMEKMEYGGARNILGRERSMPCIMGTKQAPAEFGGVCLTDAGCCLRPNAGGRAIYSFAARDRLFNMLRPRTMRSIASGLTMTLEPLRDTETTCSIARCWPVISTISWRNDCIWNGRPPYRGMICAGLSPSCAAEIHLMRYRGRWVGHSTTADNCIIDAFQTMKRTPIRSHRPCAALG